VLDLVGLVDIVQYKIVLLKLEVTEDKFWSLAYVNKFYICAVNHCIYNFLIEVYSTYHLYIPGATLITMDS
jgi:hypothetical protein